MEQKENRIVKRVYYAIEVTLLSPLSISGGEKEETDSDVLVNGNGEVFIPGTSLAGAMRSALGLMKSRKGIFGYSSGQEGAMSSVFMSDLYFDRPPVVSVRDGVRLADKKVQNKFDMEIVETGAGGILYFNYIVRERDKETDFNEGISQILQGIQNGEIRFGANKNRGFGRLKILTIYQSTFAKPEGGDKQTLTDWLEFVKDSKNVGAYAEKASFDEWKENQADVSSRYVRINIPLRLVGGISVRKYSTRPAAADFEHITCSGEPVVPGSSWNGAIRSDIKDILKELGCSQAFIQERVEQWFGSEISQGSDKVTRPGSAEPSPRLVSSGYPEQQIQSRVVIGESVIRESVRLPMTRNRIDRFSASTQDGALYSEIAYFGGLTELELMVRKDENEDHLGLLGILLLVISDIVNGFVAVGGQTAIGRGIFERDQNREVTFSEPVDQKVCLEALYSLL